jgi:hypothetical protein
VVDGIGCNGEEGNSVISQGEGRFTKATRRVGANWITSATSVHAAYAQPSVPTGIRWFTETTSANEKRAKQTYSS